MKYELTRGSKGNLILKVYFEDTGKGSNFWKKDLTWVPAIDEMKDLTEAFGLVSKSKKGDLESSPPRAIIKK